MKKFFERLLDVILPFDWYGQWKFARKDDNNHWAFIRLYEAFLGAYGKLTYNDFDEVNIGSLMTWCTLKLMNSDTLSPKDKLLIEQVEKIITQQVSREQVAEMRQAVITFVKNTQDPSK